MNIYDISKKAGVSIATVSRVLNGSDRVSAKTREKVLKVIEETQYQPNIFARGLGLDTMRTIGIVCADSSDSYLATAVYYLERELRQHNYDVLLCCTGYELETKKKYVELLLSKRVDAVIFVGSHFIESTKEKNAYIKSAAEKVPVILINGFIEGANIFCIACDDYEGQCRLTKEFLAAGKEKILYLARMLSYSGRRKMEGFKQAYHEMGMQIADDQIITFNGSIPEVKMMLIEKLKKKLKYEVILCSDDELAIGALKYAKATGISVPGQLQIAGYNNSKVAICCEPELTSIDNKQEFLCINAVTLLIQVFKGHSVSGKTMLSPDILKRNTTTI